MIRETNILSIHSMVARQMEPGCRLQRKLQNVKYFYLRTGDHYPGSFYSQRKNHRLPSEEPKPVAIPSWTFAPSKHRLTTKVLPRNSFPFAIPGLVVEYTSKVHSVGKDLVQKGLFFVEVEAVSHPLFTSTPHPARVSMHHQSPPNRRREGYFPLQFVELSSASSLSWDNKSHLTQEMFQVFSLCFDSTKRF